MPAGFTCGGICDVIFVIASIGAWGVGAGDIKANYLKVAGVDSPSTNRK